MLFPKHLPLKNGMHTCMEWNKRNGVMIMINKEYIIYLLFIIYYNVHKHRNSIGFGSVHAMRSCVKRCDYNIEEELFFELSVG